MALYRFLPNIIFPDHLHDAPEFLYLLEGSAKVEGQWIQAGWASVAGIGTLAIDFQSGDAGCVFVAVYTMGTNNI